MDSEYAVQSGFARNDVIEYTVQPGDLISFIASDYGVSVRSILWANNLRSADTLSIGQKLRIPPISGVIHKVKKGETVATIARKYGAQEEEIVKFNSLPKDGQLALDDEIIVPDGVVKAIATTGSVVSRTAKASSKFAHLPDLADYFLAPATGYNWSILHGRNGVDIANSCGTNIYAAAGGTVSLADGVGWNGGFGQYLKITHPNGTETIYAHAKKLLVSTGESISKGQLVAVMGTTGRSTGCHLHFEVHGARNPLLKYK